MKDVLLSVKIIDTGRGMKQSDLNNIFVDFSTLSETRNINPTGTGLGLSICKHFVNMMGGTIKVKSKINEGTTFKIQIMTSSVPHAASSASSIDRKDHDQLEDES